MMTKTKTVWDTTTNDSDKKQLIQKMLKKLPKDPLLHQFSELVLYPMSIRTLIHISTNSLPEVLRSQFDFFKKTVNKQKPASRLSSSTENTHWLKNCMVLECVYPDASHLLVTLESLLLSHGLRLTRRLHPIMGITRNKQGKLASIHPPKNELELISYTYLAFEKNINKQGLNTIKKEVAHHLSAVEYAHRDQKNIQETLTTIQKSLETNTLININTQKEWNNLITWLKNLNFSFFGYANYSKTKKTITLETEKRYGICHPTFTKSHPSYLQTLTTHIKNNNTEDPLRFDIIPIKSPIQRFDNLMRLAIHIKLDNNKTIIHNFLGILKRSSLQTKNIETPLIHLKLSHIFQNRQTIPGSYDYNEIIRIFNPMPKFELFRTSKEDLLQMVDNLISITNPNHIICFPQLIDKGNRLLLMIVVPPFLFSSARISIIQNYVKTQLNLDIVEMVKIPSEDKCRLHFYSTPTKKGLPKLPDPDLIEREIGNLIQPWKETVIELLHENETIKNKDQLIEIFLPLFPRHYKNRTHPQQGIDDMVNLSQLTDTTSTRFSLTEFTYPPTSDIAQKASILRVYSKKKIDLIHIIPILQNMGFHVIDQLTARIGDTTKTLSFIHAFRITDMAGNKITHQPTIDLLIETLTKVINNQTNNDPLNSLVVSLSTTWRKINILQTYRNLLLQLQPHLSKDKINETLMIYPKTTHLLCHYFEAKFNPKKSFGSPSKRLETHLPQINTTCLDSLKDVKELIEDVIIRQLLQLMEATIQTNYYSTDTTQNTAIAIKLNYEQIQWVPQPHPYREIYIHDVNFEGTHLRFGKIARGGIRWSNRKDDFRTEILGLVKTQRTKNVVIVPTGSKGGFIIKERPNQKITLELGQTYYQQFIQNLLEVTENITKKGQTIRHKNQVCYGEKDPYLVVAADKGTATFSDLANQISTNIPFWLGDAFASGGSNGYDHKKVGITAKGAWECTSLHFKSLGINPEKDPITVIGIGDMSGDVFGNGMLLSKSIKLIAAFNHMHIFIDPNPDPKKSWAERHRLFNKSHSTWLDYDPKKISKDGGVFPRSQKYIKINTTIKSLFNVPKTTLTPNELIQCILKHNIQLLWFGGIGTFIKAANESDESVSDPINNPIRINATECKAAIIGEGANLGLTQKSRIALDYQNSLLNTDAIDNSAGVNMSDYEVNLKILLQPYVNNKQITMATRHKVLEAATTEVTELVLKNNRAQHQLLTSDATRSIQRFSEFSDIITHLIQTKQLDPKTEDIPSIETLTSEHKKGTPIPRPILSVLQAYIKMETYEKLLTSPLITHPFFTDLYDDYFPNSIKNVTAIDIHTHQLKNEIIAMLITNKIINQAGSTFIHSLKIDTRKSTADIITAYFICETALNIHKLRQLILQNTTLPLQLQNKLTIHIETTLKSYCKKCLKNTKSMSLSESKNIKIDPSPLSQTQVNFWIKNGTPLPLAKKMATLNPI